MSEWHVNLVFSEGGSNKFWRARVEGGTLTINYGRIGSDGQTKVKELDSADACLAEMEKVASSKRKKGYSDDGEVRPSAAEAAPVSPSLASELPEGPQTSRLVLSAGGRRIDLELGVDGAEVRTTVVERHGSADEATAAFLRLKEAMLADGYKEAPGR